jgi:branched-chain amino acid transport system permease protein
VALPGSRISEFNSLLVSFGHADRRHPADHQLLDGRLPADGHDLNPYPTPVGPLGPLLLPRTACWVHLRHAHRHGGGYYFLERTFSGRAMRAFAQDRAIAAAFGIDHRRLGMLLAGVAGATARWPARCGPWATR